MACEILELGLKVKRHFWSELVSKVTWIRENRAMFKVNLSFKTRLHQARNSSRFQWRINWEPNLMGLRIQHIRNIAYKLKFASIWVLIQPASSKLKRPTKSIDGRLEKHNVTVEWFRSVLLLSLYFKMAQNCWKTFPHLVHKFSTNHLWNTK